MFGGLGVDLVDFHFFEFFLPYITIIINLFLFVLLEIIIPSETELFVSIDVRGTFYNILLPTDQGSEATADLITY